MSDEDSLAETEPSINAHYASEFRRHLAQVQAHLAGIDEKGLPSSYIPPTGFWTSLEKDTFFHGLSIHSRFRPDLIAACVRTKSVVDVCAYIDALEEGSSGNAPRYPKRAEIEGSVEVSDAWVQWEEKCSADLVLLECDWEDENLENQRKKEGIHGSTLGPRWLQEKTLRRLDVHHLRVMETIHRDGQSETRCEPADHSPPLARPLITDEMIDPALLEISGGLAVPSISNRHFGLSGQLPSLTTLDHTSSTQSSQIDTPDTVEETTMDPSELSPVSRRRFQKRLYMRKKRAEKTGSEFASVITKLRPGRKIKERISPKKRPKSKDSSCEDGSDEDSMNLEHIVNPHALSESQEVLQNSEQDDIPTKHAHHSKGGLTKPYRIKKKLASQGIDADVLSRCDLGLFHFSTLSRLMELYKSGYSKANTSIATTISADTIRLMTAVIVEFVSEAVHRTIVFREQEKIMKGNIKVYGRMHYDITSESVNHVLEMMGMKGLTKAKYFAELLDERMTTVSEARSGRKDDHQESGGGKHGPSDTTTDDGGEDERSPICSQDTVSFPAVSLQRELHLPLFHLRKSFTSNDSSLEDTLMPMDTDETELQNELQEEREIDDADGILARNYETELWKHSGRGNIKF